MTFIVQFRRLRRGVPEVIRELHIPSVDGAAALAAAQGIVGTRHWPVRTDALRVMDDGGRTLLDWTVPAGIPQSPTRARLAAKPAAVEPHPMSPTETTRPERRPASHLFTVGQPVSYAEDGRPDTWQGGYEIIRLEHPLDEPQYAIRSADQSYDRIVHQHELREDLGARAPGI